MTPAKKIERLRSALAILYTWAIFEGGHLLRPDDVAALTKRVLEETQ